LADAPIIPDERLESARKTAEFIVDRFNAEGVKAQLIGDRDIGLGREFLMGLAKRANYPWVATNLMDVTTEKAVFQGQVIVEVGGLKVGVMGLLATSAGRSEAFERAQLKLAPLVPAAKAALAELEGQGADIIVALSQLTPADERMVAEAVPEIQLFLGGELAQTDDPMKTTGRALSVAGGQKGKQLVLLTLDLLDPLGARAAFVDPQRRAANSRKREEASQRIATYEQLLREAGAAASGEGGALQQRRGPVEAYERQLAAARAELALADEELKALASEGPPKPQNTASMQVVQLGRSVADDPAVLKLIDEFRRIWPDLTPGH
jgi:2',3'-cyclic-nucleotide 2'-phosphodiesterase (5'-nucleotidase family)